MSVPREHAWAPRFFALWTGQQLSLAGSAVAQFALVWWLTVTTGSVTVLASASLVALLSPVALGPLGGAVIDRWSRRLVLIGADSWMALAAAGLAFLQGVGVGEGP
ncbi:MAG: MFS transporter, partial [Chloroflexia bacterium]